MQDESFTHDEREETDLSVLAMKWFRQARSRALTFVMVHPRGIAGVCLAAIAVSVGIMIAPLFQSNAAPPPNAATIANMLKAVEDRDRAVRERLGMMAEPNPESPGVFQLMRDRPNLSEGAP